MMFTSKSFVALVSLVPATLALPGASWYRRQADAQASLTLDPAVISKGLAQDGQGDNPDPGQVRSLTSTNNFINFCLGQTLTDGQQKVEGSCNPTIMGRIIGLDLSPASKFVFPKNTDASLKANQAFNIQMKVRNMVLGNFVNAQSNYYAAPQQVNNNGVVIGHTHVVIEPIPAFDSTTPLDPLSFTFFKGVNGAADGNGVVSVAVDKGVPAGFYRLCSINTAANHQPVIVSNAQHGALDDCVYFAVDQGADPFKLAAGGANNADANRGNNNVNGNGNANGNAAASDSAAVSATDSAAATATDSVVASDSAAATATDASAPAASETAAAGNDQQGNGNNQQGNGNNQQGNGNNQQGNGNNNQQGNGNGNANQQGNGNGNGNNADNAQNAQNGNGNAQNGADNANNAQNGAADNAQNGANNADNAQTGADNAQQNGANNAQQNGADNAQNGQGNGNADNATGNADNQQAAIGNGNADAQNGNNNADNQRGNGNNNAQGNNNGNGNRNGNGNGQGNNKNN